MIGHRLHRWVAACIVLAAYFDDPFFIFGCLVMLPMPGGVIPATSTR